MKQMWRVLALAIIIVSCGGRKQMSPEEIAHKLDSVRTLEIKEKLNLQGIDLETSDNPLKAFYDSLAMQTLPISYSEDFVRFLPGFSIVQPELVGYMDFGDDNDHKAACLPESVGARLILVADLEKSSDHVVCLWLYSLDEDCFPVDKLCLYAAEERDDGLELEKFVQYFSVTSDYEIHLLDYSKTRQKMQSEEIYYIDASRHFQLRETKLE